MTTLLRLTTGAALAIALALGGTASAQTAADQGHGAHHPNGAPAASAPTAPPVVPLGAPVAMPGQGGMMGGDMGRMIETMHRRMASEAAMRPLRYVEGQIAFARAELRITEAQQPQWNAFADALRSGAETLRQTAMRSMAESGPVSAPDQLQRRAALLTAQAEVMRSVEAKARPLYVVLSETQQRTADTLVTEHAHPMREAMR